MKKRRFAGLLALVSALPVIILTFFSCSVWSTDDFSSYDYFAVTDAGGAEYVYAPGESVFDAAAETFAHAKAGERPDWFFEASSLLLEWIRDGKAHRYRLYLAPTRLAAYLEDAEGNGAYPTEEGIAFLLSAPPMRTALVGTPPPAVLLDGEEIDFSVCSWTYGGTLAGEPFAVSSGDYLNRSAEVYSAGFQCFSLVCDEARASEQYTVYHGDAALLSASAAELAGSLATLGGGEYQLVAVLVWERENVKIRAGYSFSLTIS